MDVSLALPNRSTPSYKVRRAIKPRRNVKVWDFRSVTGDARDLYTVRPSGKAAKTVKPWSLRGM